MGGEVGDRWQSAQKHCAVVAILVAANMSAITAIIIVFVHYMGGVDNTMVTVVIGLVSSVAVSVISTAGYSQLKSMFGINDWQKRMEDKQDRIIAGLGENNRILREILAILRSGSVKIVAAEPGETATVQGAGDSGGGGAAADSGSH